MKAACSLDPTRAATVRRLPLCTHLIGENTESRSGNIISVLLEHCLTSAPMGQISGIV
jgi:hypothetical protein